MLALVIGYVGGYQSYASTCNTQTAAIVVFAKPSSVQKVKAAAQAASPVQLRLTEPQQAYGLKGELCLLHGL